MLGAKRRPFVVRLILLAGLVLGLPQAVGPLSRVAEVPLPGSNGPHGFLIADEHDLAYVSCEGNGELLVVDLASMGVVQILSSTEGFDVLAFDRGLRRRCGPLKEVGGRPVVRKLEPSKG
jgi:hypothetical protein